MFYIYLHKDKETDSVVYVGKGSNFRCQDFNSRSEKHVSLMKEKKLEYFILRYFENELEAYKAEESLTRYYKSIGECKFNISIGRKTSEETKKKLSKVLRGKVRSEETRERIRKNHSRNNAKEVVMYKSNVPLMIFSSSREAGIYAANNDICSYGWVGQCLKTGEATKPTKKFPIGGYRFIYKDDIIKIRKDQ